MKNFNKLVFGKTFDLALLPHSAEIYKANDAMEKVKELRERYLGVIYELGLTMEKQIKNL